MSPGQPSTRRIVMAAFPGAELLDVAGPLEVFSVASRVLAWQRAQERPAGARAADLPPPYTVEVAAEHPGPLRMESGLQLLATRSLGGVRGPVDTVLVPGGAGVDVALRSRAYMGWLARAAASSRRVASVCTGARLLAAAGLLDGRSATTHWRFCDVLASEARRTRVQPDSIYVHDGKVWTSAGITAGMDLALAMVEEDHGRRLALETARMMVLFLKRPGGQSQFSAQLESQMAEREPLRDLQAWILDHPDADLRVESLARRAGMSERNFARAFAREVGMTPARFVEKSRVDAARRHLEETARSVEEVASHCGFGTAETMRRAFLRSLATSPSAYRARFRPEKDHGDRHRPV